MALLPHRLVPFLTVTIRHSSFVTRHSSFVIRHSSLVTRHSSFVIRHSPVDIIQLLPDSVANQIAAGEVIQRPASVIKELVENAIDAGARHIDVNVVEAGRTSIQVVDDGCGMSETDARLAFERHATSKIRSAVDLFALTTMGFRGEALPSIAAVAQVELITRTADNDLGTRIVIEGSRVLEQEPVACAVGSNFTVKNLFYNTPARRKFLKTAQTEMTNITNELERIMLVHHDTTFTLTHNGQPVMSLQPTSRKGRIEAMFGERLTNKLLPLDVETPLVNIHGFVGQPEAARRRGAAQFFFVNNRFMRHPYFHRAVMEAFTQFVPADQQVPYFLYLDVAPDEIDVNIHPTKTEIKFENELAIWQILLAAARESLGRWGAVPSIDFDTEGRPTDIPVYNPSTDTRHVSAPKIQIDPTFNPFSSSGATPVRTPSDSQYAPHNVTTDDLTLIIPEDVQMSLGLEEEKSSNHFQYKGTYIITATTNGLMVVHQHRAHLRILYDQYLQRLNSNGSQLPSQHLLFPDVVQFATSESTILESMQEDLALLGFDISQLSGGTWSVEGIPVGMEGLEPRQLLLDLITATANRGTFSTEELHERMALALARSAAIPSGQVLGNAEMDDLTTKLLASTMPQLTPDGHTIYTILEDSTLEKLLK
ncbi:MAG: DNA mismatch repair endonuclease MutL [Bacteroidaceae bacterium]|nr:DNA mismatch repair endonuclease MutL [Bacteroidaceae bacterium]